MSSSWHSLSGDTPRPAQPPQPEPVYGGWQQPWLDEHGQPHYPYATLAPVPEPPPYAPPAHEQQPPPTYAEPQPERPSGLVAPEQLDPVGPPRYAAPVRVSQDPRQRTLAAVITFLALIVGLWAIMGFTGSLARTLTSIQSGTDKLRLQMVEANKGLVSLDEKTDHLAPMKSGTEELGGLLGSIDTEMGSMLTGVESIATDMTQLSASMRTLDTELGAVNTVSRTMGSQLGGINSGLASQVTSVRTMRKDVEATGRVLGTLPGRLDATNGRLAHVNNAVNVMGCKGILNNLQVEIFLGPLRNGSAEVFATVVPPGAWGTQADGRTPC